MLGLGINLWGGNADWIKGLAVEGTDPIVVADFANGLYYDDGPATSSMIDVTRSSTRWVRNASGLWVEVPADTPGFHHSASGEALGIIGEEESTGLFLNSTSPATQSITVLNATEYTLSLEGSGSATLSGGGSGVATDGSPVTFTTSSTSVTVTISGSPDHVQLELGDYASTRIVTAGSTVTRAEETVIINHTAIDGPATMIFWGMSCFASLNNASLVFTKDAALNNRMLLRTNASRSLRREVWGGGSEQDDLSLTMANLADGDVLNGGVASATGAITGAGNNLTQVNDETRTTAGAFTLATGMDRTEIASNMSGALKRFAIYPVAFTSAQIAEAIV